MTFIFSVKFKMILCILTGIYVSISLAGCSGSGESGTGPVLSVTLNTSVSPMGGGGQLPLEASTFHVWVLDQSGKETAFKEANRNPSSNSLTVTFLLTQTGSYRVRVSAFDADQVILGSFQESVTIVPGENTVRVNSLQPAEVFFTPDLTLPWAGSSQALSNFLSHDQSGLSLQSYCVWGKLVEAGKPVNAYLAIVQRMNEELELPVIGSHLYPIVIAGTGFNNEETGRIVFGGSQGIAELSEVVVVTQPWHVYVESSNPSPSLFPFNTTEMFLLEGNMGQPGARYKITSTAMDLEGEALETTVIFSDTMGIVNQGYGPASFFPQWLLPAQRDVVAGEIYAGSVGDYLKTSCDPMTDQGSYYYSLPMLQVHEFSITRNSQVISRGNDGLLWMDIVYQSFDSAALEVVNTATWNFFSLQFPQSNRALMVTDIHNDQNGSLPVASLFSTLGARSPNGALIPEFRWNLQNIEITPVPGYTWTSPESTLTYHTRYNITLGGARQADLVVAMAWNAQEFKANDTVKYEGYATVSGTLDGENVEGSAWVEVQPADHL